MKILLLYLSKTIFIQLFVVNKVPYFKIRTDNENFVDLLHYFIKVKYYNIVKTYLTTLFDGTIIIRFRQY